jgi:hypothetical protein
MGRKLEVGGDRVLAFNLDEYKLVLRIYYDYKSWGPELDLLRLQSKTLTEVVQTKDLQIGSLMAQNAILFTEKDRLASKWVGENKARLILAAG